MKNDELTLLETEAELVRLAQLVPMKLLHADPCQTDGRQDHPSPTCCID